MTTSTGLSVGSLGIQGNAVRLLGGASSLDTERLVEALATAKRAPALRIEQRIERNETRAAALEELRGLLDRLREAADGLRNPPGALGIESNLFERKEAFLSTSGSVAASDIVGVQATARSQAQRFTLEVERLATAHKIRADSATSQSQTLADAFNGGAAFAGSFTIGLAGGPTATISVSGTTTLEELRDAIEAQSATTGVRASLLTVGPNDVRLVLSAGETGRAISLAAAGGDEVLDRIGLTAGGVIKHELVAAQTAQFRIDGQTLERSSNLVSDAVSGVTLNLFRAAPGQNVEVSIEPSREGVREAIANLVEGYNALKDFADRHQTIGEDGSISSEAVLFGDRLLRGALSAVDSALATRVAGVPSGSFDQLGAIGISRDANGKLVLDEAKLDRALVGDFDKVRDLLEFRSTVSSVELRVVGRGNAIGDREFQVSITDTNGDGIPESATLDGVAATVEGRRIKGITGTPYEGLELSWVGSGSQTIDVSFTQGVADRLYNGLQAFIEETYGAIERETAAIAEDNRRLSEEVERLDQQVTEYRVQLYEKFSKLEQALTLTKTLLAQVEAQARAFDSGRS